VAASGACLAADSLEVWAENLEGREAPAAPAASREEVEAAAEMAATAAPLEDATGDEEIH
tara:strand:+ start:743 stop:922 length:180 start_codon:yes stop_codon:yes gene_type:complete